MIQDRMFENARHKDNQRILAEKAGVPIVELGSKTSEGRPNFYRCSCGWGAYYSEYATGCETKRECPTCHKVF